MISGQCGKEKKTQSVKIYTFLIAKNPNYINTLRGALKHIKGAYSRNAPVGLLLCSEKLPESDRKEQ